MKLGNLVNTNLGFRIAVCHVNGKNYVSYEPRILANFLVTKNISLKGAYSKMQQNVHLLTNSIVDLLTDLWVPAMDEVALQILEQWSGVIAKFFHKGIYEVSIEGYYKKMQNLIECKDGARFIEPRPVGKFSGRQWRGYFLERGTFAAKKKTRLQVGLIIPGLKQIGNSKL